MAKAKSTKKAVAAKLPIQEAEAATEAVAPQPLLQRAFATVHGARQADYGDKLANFAQIAMGMQMVLARKLKPGEAVTPEDVGFLMMQVKLARLAHMPHHEDSLLDIAGYAECVDVLRSERAAILAGHAAPLPGAINDYGIRYIPDLPQPVKDPS